MQKTCLDKLGDIDSWLATSESHVKNLRPGCEKRVIWAGDTGVKTDVAVVYVHGFSASPEELRPLPDLVARGLGANLHYTRLTGHGQDGAAMALATFADWRADMAEALAVGQRLGDKVILMGCSTGCTLMADALSRGAQAMGAVMISPNFGMSYRLAQMVLDAPFSRIWLPWVAGRQRSFDVKSPAHAAYWTTSYPTAAIFPMGDAVQAAFRAAYDQVRTPAMFVTCSQDSVVSPARTAKIMARWGAPVHHHAITLGPEDDAMGHLVAGDVFSPAQTAPLAAVILDWCRAELGCAPCL